MSLIYDFIRFNSFLLYENGTPFALPVNVASPQRYSIVGQNLVRILFVRIPRMFLFKTQTTTMLNN